MRIAASHGTRTPPPLRVRLRWWTVTHWLIAINVAVYIANLLLGDRLRDLGEFTAQNGIFQFQIWRWITYSFLHASPSHLLFNMLALWGFGPPVEMILRPRRYLAFYILSGLGGVLGYLLLWRLHFLDVDRYTSLIGASACIFGIIMGAAYLAPKRIIRFMISAIQLQMQTLAWILIGVAILYIAARTQNAGGEAAHLGGAVVGYALIRNMHWFSAVGLAPKRRKFWKPGDPHTSFFKPDA